MGSYEIRKNTEAVVARFIEHLRTNKMSDHTVRAYAFDVTGFLHQYAGRAISSEFAGIVEWQTQDIADYLSNLARTGSRFASVRRTSCALKKFFTFLVSEGVMKNNPAEALRVTPLQPGMLSSAQIVAVFRYLNWRQASTESGDNILSLRDELVLLFMMLYGFRQYQIGALKLSDFRTSDKSVSVVIGSSITVRLHTQVLRILRAYLESRNSGSDTLFLESLGRGPLGYWGIRHALNDLSQALQIDCSPKSLHNTYLYLQQHQEMREALMRQVFSIGSTHNYGITTNA